MLPSSTKLFRVQFIGGNVQFVDAVSKGQARRIASQTWPSFVVDSIRPATEAEYEEYINA